MIDHREKTIRVLGIAYLILLLVIWLSWVIQQSKVREENQIREFQTGTGNMCVVSNNAIDCDWK